MTTTQQRPAPLHAPRWLIITLVIAGAIVLAAFLVVRALPTKAEVRMQVGAWELPAGLVISSDDLRTQYPGLAIGSMLGKTTLQVNGGVIVDTNAAAFTLDAWTSDGDTAYALTRETVALDLNHPFSGSDAALDALAPGDQIAVVTLQGEQSALLIFVGVRRE